MNFPIRRPVQPKEDEGCRMKIERDSQGNIKGIKTNGKCKAELEMIKNKDIEIEK